MMKRAWLLIGIPLLYASSLCLAQNSESNQKLSEQARQEFVAGKFGDAESSFRELTDREPSDIYATTYLGHALFRQGKYADAAAA